MKTKFLTFALLFITVSTFAQQLEYQVLASEVKRPKELNKAYLGIATPYEDNILCIASTYKLPLVDTKLLVMDKQLNIVKFVTLPDKYKKYSFTYLCKIGNHHIISIYKGLHDRLLGLLDENLQLVTTYQLGHDFTFERVVYHEEDYVVLNVNGHQLIKVDENLNVLQKSTVEAPLNFYINDWRSSLINGHIALEKPSTIYFIDLESLEISTKLNLPENYYSFFCENVFSVHSYTWDKDYNGDWSYIAKMYDYKGTLLQELNLKADNKDTHKVEQWCDDLWDKSQNRFIVARTTKPSMSASTQLAFYIIDKDKIETRRIEDLNIDYTVSSIQLLDIEDESIRILIASQGYLQVLSVDLQTLSHEVLLTKKCDAAFPKHPSMRKNEAGYYLVWNDVQVNQLKSNGADGTAYDKYSAIVFISKDMSECKIHTSSYLTLEQSVSNQFMEKQDFDNFVVILHREPRYNKFNKNTQMNELQFYVLDNHGNKTIKATGLDYFRSNQPRIKKFSPSEYYLLYTPLTQVGDVPGTDVYSLFKLTFKEMQ